MKCPVCKESEMQVEYPSSGIFSCPKCKRTILYKGTCKQCGKGLWDYDFNYSDGKITLCSECFDKYKSNHKVIIRYYPAFVENGNDYDFYNWIDLQTFLKDNQYPGFEHQWSENGPKDIHIMIQGEKEHWVVWSVSDPSIIKEVRKGLKHWSWKR